MRQTHLFHAIAQQGFDTLHERLKRLFRFFRVFVDFIRQFFDGLIGFSDRLECFTVKLGQVVHHPLVNAIGEQQHFDAFLTQQLQVRAVFRRRIAVCGDVVDFFLPFFHPGDVIFQRHGLGGRVGMGGGKAQQFSDRFLVGVIFRRAFFQHQTELFPEGLVFFRVVFRQFFQHLQDAFGQSATQITRYRAVLQDFTGDVQRQVIRINQAAHETQIVRHELLGIVHNEHALYVQLQTMFVIAVPQIPRRLRRDIQQAGVLLLTFHAVVAPGQRIGEIMRDVLVKLVVLVVFNFRLVTGPQRLGLVDFLPGNHGFAVFFFPFFNLYRQCDVIGIFTDN